MKKRTTDSTTSAGIAAAATETVQRHGSAIKEHLVALDGIDHETGQALHRSLRDIAGYKVNPDYVEGNLKEQAGFSAEIKDAARGNARRIIAGDDTRTVRTDDIGRVNDQQYDHVELDGHGNIIAGSGTQMKFVGGDPKEAFDKLMSPGYAKYRDNNIPFKVPSDYYDGIKTEANEKIASLQRQVETLDAQGKHELAHQKLDQIKEIEKVRDNLKQSELSRQEAMEARVSPVMSTAKDVARVAWHGGVEGAKYGAEIGGGISAILNIVAVVKGEKEVGEAVKDTAVGTAKSAAVGFAVGGAGSALKGVMQNSSSNVVRNLSKTAVPAMAVTAAMDTLKTLNRLRKGEIDGVQCLEELGQSATAKMSAAAFASYGAVLGSAIPGPGNLIGAVVGGIVGHALASHYYQEALDLLKDAKMAREERIRIEAECAAAKQMYQKYRAEFESAFTRYMSECRQAFDLALRDMRDALEMGDADWFIAGANRVSRQMGREPQFETRAEFDALMESSEAFVL